MAYDEKLGFDLDVLVDADADATAQAPRKFYEEGKKAAELERTLRAFDEMYEDPAKFEAKLRRLGYEIKIEASDPEESHDKTVYIHYTKTDGHKISRGFFKPAMGIWRPISIKGESHPSDPQSAKKPRIQDIPGLENAE